MQSTAVEPVTHYVTLEASANALAVNRDASQVVVAGRNGMSNIYNIFSLVTAFSPCFFKLKITVMIAQLMKVICFRISFS